MLKCSHLWKSLLVSSTKNSLKLLGAVSKAESMCASRTSIFLIFRPVKQYNHTQSQFCCFNGFRERRLWVTYGKSITHLILKIKPRHVHRHIINSSATLILRWPLEFWVQLIIIQKHQEPYWHPSLLWISNHNTIPQRFHFKTSRITSVTVVWTLLYRLLHDLVTFYILFNKLQSEPVKAERWVDDEEKVGKMGVWRQTKDSRQRTVDGWFLIRPNGRQVETKVELSRISQWLEGGGGLTWDGRSGQIRAKTSNEKTGTSEMCRWTAAGWTL